MSIKRVGTAKATKRGKPKASAFVKKSITIPAELSGHIALRLQEPRNRHKLSIYVTDLIADDRERKGRGVPA